MDRFSDVSSESSLSYSMGNLQFCDTNTLDEKLALEQIFSDSSLPGQVVPDEEILDVKPSSLFDTSSTCSTTYKDLPDDLAPEYDVVGILELLLSFRKFSSKNSKVAGGVYHPQLDDQSSRQVCDEYCPTPDYASDSDTKPKRLRRTPWAKSDSDLPQNNQFRRKRLRRAEVMSLLN